MGRTIFDCTRTVDGRVESKSIVEVIGDAFQDMMGGNPVSRHMFIMHMMARGHRAGDVAAMEDEEQLVLLVAEFANLCMGLVEHEPEVFTAITGWVADPERASH